MEQQLQSNLDALSQTLDTLQDANPLQKMQIAEKAVKQAFYALHALTTAYVELNAKVTEQIEGY